MGTSGKVFLVGAGPGDPDLLTLKAYKLIQSAQVILYDRLVSDEIMALVPQQCECIYVGKRRADHSVPQKDIGQLLIDYARQNKFTVRLKGGDPFIFGRGGEELEDLAQAGIAFEVIPGITAASGCASYAGIPLTHRDYSQSVRFITGHLKEQQVNLDWSEFANRNQTIVFYMGLVGLPKIAEQLLSIGRSPKTPVAIIEKGTTPNQKVTITSLAEINPLLANVQFKAPTLVIVGDVVSLRQRLWPDKSRSPQ